MKNNKRIRVLAPAADLDAVRYAAYAQSGAAYVFLGSPSGGKVAVEFELKPGAPRSAAASLAGDFRRELADEKLRSRVAADNAELREFLLLKALNYSPQKPAEQDSGLTPAQEKELNDLIAKIEKEIKTDASGADPLGIASTWEEKYGDDRKKKR